MRRVAGDQVPHNAGDFRLVSRRVVEAISRLPEQGRVHRLLIPWFGFPSAEVTFVRDTRAAGTTKYPLPKMLALAFDSVAAFSAAPLRIATWAGFIGGIVGVLAIAWSLYGWFTGSTVPGWTSILATAGLIGAIQLICLGLLGEYVSRIFAATQQRPTYLVGYDSLREKTPPEAD
jgi:dolichol-phosphate mannosyltransferase